MAQSTQFEAGTGKDRERRPVVPFTCGSCDAKWTAPGLAHCGGCCRSFSTTALFDAHRSQSGKHGTCLGPASILTKAGERRMVLRGGLWRGPEMTEEQKAQRFGRAA